MLPCNVQYRTSTKIDNENALSKQEKIQQRNETCSKVLIKAPIVGLSN